MEEMKQIDYSSSIVETMDYDKKAIPQKKIMVLKVNKSHPSTNKQYTENVYYTNHGTTL